MVYGQYNSRLQQLHQTGMTMSEQISVAFNIRPDGLIVVEGDHAPGSSNGMPFDLVGIDSKRSSTGIYRVTGRDVFVPDGWRASIFRDENDERTIRLAIQQGPGFIDYICTDPSSSEPKDIVNLLTVRVMVQVDVPEPIAIPFTEEESVLQ